MQLQSELDRRLYSVFIQYDNNCVKTQHQWSISDSADGVIRILKNLSHQHLFAIQVYH